MKNEQLSLPEPTDSLHIPPSPDGLRLEDPNLDAAWQAQRTRVTQSVPTDDLSSGQKNANARAAEAAHGQRSTDQILDQQG